MARKPAVNVVRRGDRWAVIRDGADKASRVFDTQKDAIDFGQPIAQRDQTELRIQGRDARWRDSDSYGNDPASSVDKKH